MVTDPPIDCTQDSGGATEALGYHNLLSSGHQQTTVRSRSFCSYWPRICQSAAKAERDRHYTSAPHVYRATTHFFTSAILKPPNRGKPRILPPDTEPLYRHCQGLPPERGGLKTRVLPMTPLLGQGRAPRAIHSALSRGKDNWPSTSVRRPVLASRVRPELTQLSDQRQEQKSDSCILITHREGERVAYSLDTPQEKSLSEPRNRSTVWGPKLSAVSWRWQTATSSLTRLCALQPVCAAFFGIECARP